MVHCYGGFYLHGPGRLPSASVTLLFYTIGQEAWGPWSSSICCKRFLLLTPQRCFYALAFPSLAGQECHLPSSMNLSPKGIPSLEKATRDFGTKCNQRSYCETLFWEAVGFLRPCGHRSILGSRGCRCFGALSRCLVVSQLMGSKVAAEPSSARLTRTCLLFLSGPPVLSYETVWAPPP